MTPLLTPEQAALILGVSGSTVRRMLNRGELRGVRVGGQWRLRAESLTDWVAAHETGGGQPVSDVGVQQPGHTGIWGAAQGAARRSPSPSRTHAGHGLSIGPAPENPAFPSLWGLPATDAASPAAGSGRSARTKKRAG